jgi:2-dehydro-3-deoxyphosphogluconate aldolase/(4S)-4-hydroxy-2-oxoglutarate aldolase
LTKAQVLETLKAGGIIPVIRADSADTAVRVSEALVAGGIRTLEITMTVPDALAAIRTVAEQLGDDVLLGAGTVTDAPTAAEALDAGARFLVSPCVVDAVVRLARERDVPMLPGALTPSEVFTAHSLGGDMIKIFPASAVGGPAYIKALKGPFPSIEFCPTGGVNLDTIAEFVKAGSAAVGVGGELVLKSAIQSGDYARVTELARRYTAAIADARR